MTIKVSLERIINGRWTVVAASPTGRVTSNRASQGGSSGYCSPSSTGASFSYRTKLNVTAAGYTPVKNPGYSGEAGWACELIAF
jgi:hypothetical protein